MPYDGDNARQGKGGNREAIRPKIWIDADACPRVIKEIVFRASERLNLGVLLVANTTLAKHHSGLIESIVVAEGFDAADDYIAGHASPNDLVITADIPLAARIVANGGVALDPRGDLYTEENVGERLSVRDLMMELRQGGLIQGGPSAFNLADRQRFASSLDRLLTRMIRGDRPVPFL
ncbi:YaiI/YqxD family protein [Geobacter sp. OR-1]|uniref:YaiI/YqxD family protein n=1 Tax=Geobacter sp. OR-1 TaxID=1266765 RepID=UPI0009DCB054